jgi:hypothetical protein
MILISRQTFSEFLFPLSAGWHPPSQHACSAYVIDDKVLLLLLLLLLLVMVMVIVVVAVITMLARLFMPPRTRSWT